MSLEEKVLKISQNISVLPEPHQNFFTRRHKDRVHVKAVVLDNQGNVQETKSYVIRIAGEVENISRDPRGSGFIDIDFRDYSGKIVRACYNGYTGNRVD